MGKMMDMLNQLKEEKNEIAYRKKLNHSRKVKEVITERFVTLWNRLETVVSKRSHNKGTHATERKLDHSPGSGLWFCTVTWADGPRIVTSGYTEEEAVETCISYIRDLHDNKPSRVRLTSSGKE